MGSESLTGPNARGWFGEFGGRFAPETLMAPVEELEKAYLVARNDPSFQAELAGLLKDFAGRPTPLFHAQRISERLGGAQIYLKREDLLHTGAHKINNCLGQGLLAKRMGKTRLVAETGAGQHGVATATIAALLGMECVVYMGEEDMARQAPNVFRMRLLGTRVVGVSSGTKTLKDAINEGMRDWVTNVHNTHYLMGSVLGPHPYPMMVRDFHRITGQEARRQALEKVGRLPDLLCACVGGGSNSIGLFYEFIPDSTVKMVGVEAGGRGPKLGDHAARFSGGKPGVLHGSYTYVLQTDRRADRQHALDFRRARLSRHRTRACPVAPAGARRVHPRQRSRSAGSRQPAGPRGGNYPGTGIVARARRSHQAVAWAR